MRTYRQYALNGVAGLVETRTARESGAKISLYQSDQSGIEMDITLPWTTVCETHGACVSHSSLYNARGFMAEPSVWCEECAKLADKKKKDKTKQ